MADIDPSPYVRAPQADAPGAVALGISIITAVPKQAPLQVKASAKKLRTSVLALQTAWHQASVRPKRKGKRAADAAVDNGWGCLESRLESYARLPVERKPKAARAREIHTALFGDGMDWLTLPYKTQWAEGERRLDLIKKEGFEADINALAGPEFLEEVRETQKEYGEVLSITKEEEVSPEVQLTEPLREVGRAVVDHALQLLAWASHEPDAAPAVRKALRPIDEHRAASARRAASAPGEAPPPAAEPTPPAATPTTPVPEVPS